MLHFQTFFASNLEGQMGCTRQTCSYDHVQRTDGSFAAGPAADSADWVAIFDELLAAAYGRFNG